MHIPLKFFKLHNRTDLKTQAYVGIDPIVFPSAHRGSDLVHGIPVREHPYFDKWKFSEAQTREMASYRMAPNTVWITKTAIAVCRMRGWEFTEHVPMSGHKRGRYNTIGNIATRKEAKIKS